MRLLALTAFAMLAFAGNSVLTRAALAGGADGAGAFAAVRIACGAVVLVLLAARTGARWTPALPDAPAVLALFGYVAAFSLAYRDLAAGAGALILFGTVQLTMAGLAAARGAAPSRWEVLGLAIAFAGLAYLLAPGLAAPPLAPSALMALAGACWGVYTLLGRSAGPPLAATARNFVGCAPLVLLAPALEGRWALDPAQWWLAAASGALTSGLGYAVWYAALPRLSVATAGAAQLSVPALAALGGALVLGEQLSPRLLLASALILAGIGCTLWARTSRNREPTRAPGA